MPTPNRGYVYPTTTSPATVPADLQAPLEQIDADVQTLVDEAAAKVGLNADGTAPPALEAQVRALISAEATSPDLSAYSTTAEVEGMVDDKIEAALAETDGMIPIFPTLAEAQAWEDAHPGRLALTVEDPSPDTTPPSPGDLVVTPEGTKAHVSVVGASDDRFAPVEYSIRRDGGAWTSWQTEPSFTLTGLSALTSYTVSHRVRDGGGNIVVGPSPATFTTLAADLWGTGWVDDFDSGGLLEGRAMSRGSGTWRLPVALGTVGVAPDHSEGFTEATMPRLIGGKVQNSAEVNSTAGRGASQFLFPIRQNATGALVQLPEVPGRVEISMTVMAGSGSYTNRIIPIIYGASPSVFTTIEMASGSDVGGNTQFWLVRGNGGVRTGGGQTAETPKTGMVGDYSYLTEATLTVEIQGRSLSMWHGSTVLIEDHTIPETIPLDGAWFGFAFATNSSSASVDNFSVRWE